MEAVADTPPSYGRPFTRADLDDTPDDGHRYELIDGVLVVSPAPGHLHQRGVLHLAMLLYAACPDDLEVLVAPFDVALNDETVMQPDVLVARRSDITPRDLPTAPVLAVEFLSPSTRRFDLMLKRSRFESAGVGAYWVVDPDVPSITAWVLRDGVLRDAGQACGDEALNVTDPFPVQVVPSALVREKR